MSAAVQNVYLPKPAVLQRVVAEIPEVKTFYWRFEDDQEQQAFQRFRPGQFAQISLFGVGEFPASLPSSPDEKETFFTIRKVGVARPPWRNSGRGRNSRCAVLTATASPWRTTTAKTWCSWPAGSA